MKKKTHLILFLLCLCIFGVINVYAQKNIIKDDFVKMSFSAELNKDEYIPFEPLFVQMEVSNKTDESLNLLSILDFKKLFVEVTFDGMNKTVGSLFVTGPARLSFPVVVKKGESFNKSIILEKNLSKMFPKPGQYKIRFVLYTDYEGLQREIKSETKEITVKEPTGIDKEAVEFLRTNQNQSSDTLLWWNDQNRGLELMETFVQNYSESEIGEYMIFQLGISYFNGGEFEKAETEFNKIKNSSNKYIADNANKSLLEIKQKRLTDGTRREKPLTSKVN